MPRNLQDELNRCMPIAQSVGLGDLLQEMVTAYNDLATKHNAAMAKLDADAGVTDADYAATLNASTTAIKDINERQ